MDSAASYPGRSSSPSGRTGLTTQECVVKEAEKSADSTCGISREGPNLYFKERVLKVSRDMERQQASGYQMDLFTDYLNRSAELCAPSRPFYLPVVKIND